MLTESMYRYTDVSTIICDGCHKLRDNESENDRLVWRMRTLPFLPNSDGTVKYYCDECWVKMIRATEFGGST